MAEKKKLSERTKKTFWAIFSMVLAGLTIWAVLKQSQGVSLSDLLHVAASANKFYIIASVMCAALFVWFEGRAIRSILKGAGYKCKRRQCLVYSTSDIYFSAITPSATGGQPASAYFMMRDGIPAGVVTATLILNLMMYTVSIVVLGIIAVCMSPMSFFEFRLPSKILILAGLTVLTVLALLFLSILKKGDWIFDIASKVVVFFGRKGIFHNLDGKLAKIEKIRADYRSCSELIAGRSSVLVKSFVWNFLQRTSQLIVPVLLYLSQGKPLGNATALFVKQCLVTIGFNFVPIPGAMGVADYLMLDGFTAITGREAAFELEMLSRAITFYICVAVSGIITLIGYLIKRRKK